MRNLTAVSTAALTMALSATAAAQTVHIKNAKIVTNGPQGIIETGSLTISEGQIVGMGANLSAPRGDVQIIDANGGWVTPGLFVPYSQLGLTEVSQEGSTNDSRSSKSNTSISEMAADGFNPQTPNIDNTRIEGITHAAVSMSPGKNLFSGVGLIADMSGTFGSVINDTAFAYVQMGSRGASKAGGSRAAAMAQLRAALDDADAYPEIYSSPTDGDTLSRRDAAAMRLVADGDIPLLVGMDRASDILRLIKLNEDYPALNLIIVGAAEGWMVATEIADADLKVMIDPHNNLPDSFDFVGARLDNANLLHDAGVEFAITTLSADSNHNVRVLPQHAGNAVGNGLDWDTAFAAISEVPARWFGVETGTLSRGDAATLVIWDGDPLELTSSPTAIYIDGETQSLESRQTKLRDRYGPLADAETPHKYR